VIIADRRHHHNGDVETEVAHELPNDGDLLVVLLAKVSTTGACNRKQFGNDGGHTIKVTGTMLTLKALTHPPHVHHGGRLVRVVRPHGRHTGRDERGRPVARGASRVVVRCHWIGGKVGAIGELEGIYETRHQRHVTVLDGGANQRRVSVVQRTHGGNQANAGARGSLGCGEVSPLLEGGERQHEVLVVMVSSVPAHEGAVR